MFVKSALNYIIYHLYLTSDFCSVALEANFSEIEENK